MKSSSHVTPLTCRSVGTNSKVSKKWYIQVQIVVVVDVLEVVRLGQWVVSVKFSGAESGGVVEATGGY